MSTVALPKAPVCGVCERRVVMTWNGVCPRCEAIQLGVEPLPTLAETLDESESWVAEQARALSGGKEVSTLRYVEAVLDNSDGPLTVDGVWDLMGHERARSTVEVTLLALYRIGVLDRTGTRGRRSTPVEYSRNENWHPPHNTNVMRSPSRQPVYQPGKAQQAVEAYFETHDDWIGTRVLREALGISESSVRRVVRALADVGALEKQGKHPNVSYRKSSTWEAPYANLRVGSA